MFQGENQKPNCLQNLCNDLKITLNEVAYIGDDLNDLDVLKSVGLSAIPPNSPLVNNSNLITQQVVVVEKVHFEILLILYFLKIYEGQ